MPTKARVEALVAMVEKGQFVEAIETFYHPHASMQENNEPPRTGLQALVDYERGVMARFATMVTRPVEVVLVGEEHAVVRWVFEMTGPDGRTTILDELALQRWEGDRIAEERFYYDPAQTRPG